MSLIEAVTTDAKEQRSAHEGTPCGRDATSPWTIPLAGWSDVLWRIRGELKSDNVVVVAAGVAFFGMLGLVPTVAVIASIYGLVANPADVAHHLAVFSKIIPAAGGEVVRSLLADVVANSKGVLSARAVAGIAVALWSASRGMRALMRGLTIAYDEDRKGSWVGERARSYVFTAAAIGVTALTIGTAVVVPPALAYVGVHGSAHTVVTWMRWPVLMVVMTLSLCSLYRHGAGRAAPKWRWTVIGAVVATLLWLAGCSLLSLYINHIAQLGVSYGPLGAFLVLMLWCFVTAFAILLGAELNAELEHQTEHDTTTGEPKPLGQRGAFVADNVGPCRPIIGRMILDKIARALDAARRKLSRKKS